MMTVTTARLTLRQPAETDVEAIFELHSDPKTNLHNPAGPMKHRSDAVSLFKAWDEHLHKYGYGYWTVARLDTPETVIGFGGVMKKQITPELFDTNLYFRFRPETWGQGYAGEMVEAALECAFNVWSQEHVVGYTRAHNAASCRTLEHAGFRRVGTISDVAGEAPSLLYKLERDQFSEYKRLQRA